MAASALAEPGTKFGPCRKGCAHRDCAANRATAAAECRFCSAPIGYDTAFYRDDEPRVGWVHAVCFETAVEQGRA
jgi:hypothetical protein